jgi:hypothetical protein
MTPDENTPQISDGGVGQNPPPLAADVPADHGPDGKFLPGNHAAGEHLFKPGVSGNPNGRPSTRRFTARLREALDKNDGEMTKAMVNVACQRALRGDFRYFKEIIDRVEGKVDRTAEEAQSTMPCQIVITSFSHRDRELQLASTASDTNPSAS